MCDNDQKGMVLHLLLDAIVPAKQNSEKKPENQRSDNLVVRLTPREEKVLMECNEVHVCEDEQIMYNGFIKDMPLRYATAPEQEKLYFMFNPVGLNYSLKKSVENSKYLHVEEPDMHIEKPYLLHN